MVVFADVESWPEPEMATVIDSLAVPLAAFLVTTLMLANSFGVVSTVFDTTTEESTVCTAGSTAVAAPFVITNVEVAAAAVVDNVAASVTVIVRV
jgi:hypothetical protein